MLKELTARLGLHGDPAEALRRRYGARPKPVFVQDAWPTLLDTWLAQDVHARQTVVGELRKMGLGKTDIPVRTGEGQQEYLQSCRNAPTLRQVVLSAFLAAGEPQPLQVPRMPDVPTERAGSDVDRPAPAPDTKPGEAQPGSAPSDNASSESLDEWIEHTLESAYGIEKLQRDSDGDIPIPRGSSVVYVQKQDPESPFLEIFAPLVRGFRHSANVYEAVNTINAQVRMAKATVIGDDLIMLNALLLTDTLSPRELLFTIDLVSDAADYFDTMLQKRFGGDTMLADDHDSIDV